MAVEIDPVDVTYALDQSGELRVSLGDQTSGVGFAAGATLWGAGDGFIGLPCAPTAGGACAQALMLTSGYLRVALATKDTRWDAKAGQLGPGDRAIVSNCDAAFRLTAAVNKVALLSTNVSVVVDGAAGTIASTTTGGSSSLGPSSASMTFGDGSVSIDASSLTLQLGPLVLVMTGTTVSIATQSGPPAVLTLNLVPVTVP